MTIKASGGSNNLKFSEIESEFGQNGQRSLGDYRVSETNGSLSNMPLDTGIPQSGQIKFSDFYSKKLNIVVDLHSGSSETRRIARNHKYNSTATSTGQSTGNWRVVGGFRNRPTDSGEAPTGGVRGKKVFINVNKTLGSNSSSTQTRCALRTGNWESETDLVVDIGGSGKIYGGGGAGGKGNSKESPSGINGGDGNSALGITYSGTTVNIASGGLICMGYGGGGGGGTAHNKDEGNAHRYGSGSGGGGGAGFPGGVGGEGTNTDGTGERATDGTAGSLPDFSDSSRPTGGGRSGVPGWNDHWWEARGGLGGVGGPGAYQKYRNVSAHNPTLEGVIGSSSFSGGVTTFNTTENDGTTGYGHAFTTGDTFSVANTSGNIIGTFTVASTPSNTQFTANTGSQLVNPKYIQLHYTGPEIGWDGHKTDHHDDPAEGGPGFEDGGAAGANGAAIRRTSGISVTINGNNANTVKGSTTATGVS